MSPNKAALWPHFQALESYARRYIGAVHQALPTRLCCGACPQAAPQPFEHVRLSSALGRTLGVATLACAAGWSNLASAQWAVAAALPAQSATTPAAVAPAAAAPNLAALPPGVLEQGLSQMKQAAQSLAPKGARVVVAAGAPDQRLKLGPCSAGLAYLVPGVPAWGSSRLGVRCTQGAAWSIQLPVKVEILAPAVIAAAALSSGATLSAAQLTLAEVDWGAHAAPSAVTGLGRSGASLFSDGQALEARVLSRPVAAGAPVRAADLQIRQWFAAGTTVSVVAVGGGFSVVAEGQALSAGLEGQLVRVRTEGGRVVAGQATGDRRVEVRL